MKKKAAIAMSLMTVAGSVVPAFADEIIGRVDKNFNLDELRSEINKDRVQAEKNLEKTIEAIKELIAEEDSNGNKVYEYTVEDVVEQPNPKGAKYSCTYVRFTSLNDVDKAPVTHEFKFYKEMVDQDFGVDIKVQRVAVDVTKEEEKIKLAKYLYEIDAAGSKVYTNLEEIKEAASSTKTSTKIKVYLPEGENGIQIGQIDVTGVLFNNKGKFLINEVSANNDFRGHWAEEQIVLAMIEKKVDNSRKFRPDEDITRAEFAKIACTAYGIDTAEYDVDEKDDYSDVNRYEWYAKYVKALTDKGIVSGDGNGTFRPNDKITREEAAVIVATVLNGGKVDTVTTDVNGNRVHKDIVTDFSDDAKISNWADESVQYLYSKGISNGYKVSDKIANEYRPANNISRAESLVMMTREVDMTPFK